MPALDQRNDRQPDGNRSRNVTPRDLIQVAFVVVAGVILGWYREMGSKTAALIFAVVHVVGLFYYLRIPAEERKRASQRAMAELKQSRLGRLRIGFMYLLGFVLVVPMLHSFVAG